ncbi:YfhO family protein [Lawsonibacter sp. OA9]|uniref:YfhO family protein n=1 Tax=Oscillospiraceae TaxID=216572 RepID=UPI001F065D27|nr:MULTISPECIES: YfhO family protein [Oscillospiraceae]MCH1980903.1 YfhO family protein [Lawsonibacter sp. OA9]MCH1981500.1 YfhO family protein [Ruminococcus sp. OA3]
MKQHDDTFSRNKHIMCGVLLASVLILGCACVLSNGIFGSKVDWISQHSVLPDYFRQLFYKTGQLFPNFAPDIGGGQNIYNFSYYGLFSPLILMSYMLPFVKMADYIMAVSVLGLAASVYLFYTWLVKRGFSVWISFSCSLLFLLAAPMIYHSYNQWMFINYMPFLCLGFLGTDRLVDRRRSGLLIVAVFLMIMTSFYFSIGGMGALFLYGLHRFLQENKAPLTASLWIQSITRLLCPLIAAVCMAGILLIPSAAAIFGSSRPSSQTVSAAQLLIPELKIMRLLYSPYGLGLTSLVVTVLITGAFWKRAGERILIWGLIALFIIPAAGYLLNGGLYEKDKVFIPFLPLLCYVIAYYMKKVYQVKANGSFRAKMLYLLPYLFVIFLLFISRHQEQYQNYWKFILIDAAVLLAAICPCLYLNKLTAPLPVLLSCGFLFSYCMIYHGAADMAVSREFYEELTSSDISDTISSIGDDLSGFRLEQSGTHTENSANFNRVHADGQKISSLYSSACNPYYRTFREETFDLEQPYRNYLMQGVSQNPLFRRLMGVKYILSEDAQFDYQKRSTENGISVWENRNTAPIGYVTDRLISDQDYENLSFPHSQLIFSQASVVPDSNIPASGKSAQKKIDVSATQFVLPKQKDSVLDIQATDSGYEIHAAKKARIDVQLPDGTKSGDLLFLQFQIENLNPEKDISIKIGTVNNKLTSVNHDYYNSNTTFTYVLGIGNGKTSLPVTFKKGDYRITDMHACSVSSDVLNDNSLYSQPFQIDEAQSGGDVMTGTVTAEQSGWFISSVPYDRNFKITVDGQTVQPQKVNTAFLGFPLAQGEHQIEIRYRAPGKTAGWFCTFTGILLCIFCVRQRRSPLNS